MTHKQTRDSEIAHNVHKIAVQPYLRKIINLTNERPKKSAFKIKVEIDLVNTSWLKYCSNYERINKLSKWPDREMFTKSIKMYFEANGIYEKDLNTIFVT
jgi:hypothetical protein